MKFRLRSTYYFLRPVIPLRVRWYLQSRWAKRINGFATQPMWPLPEVQENAQRFIWPQNKRASLVLTHDVDAPYQFDTIKKICEVERRLGLRGSWNIVPNLYEVDERTLVYLRSTGMEIGVHDWNHDGKLFSSQSIFHRRVKQINQVIESWGVKGFRAGSAFHNDTWMTELACEYDSSYYDTDPFQPMGGGCAMVWPFRLGHLVELPYTMPQDHVLFVAGMTLKVPREAPPYLGLDGRKKNWEWIKEWCEKNITDSGQEFWVIQGVDIWKMKAEWLFEKGGMVLMLVHPDYLCHPRFRAARNVKAKRMHNKGWMSENDQDIQAVRERGVVEEDSHGSLLEQYAGFLNWFQRNYGSETWHCLPREMARWMKRTVKSQK